MPRLLSHSIKIVAAEIDIETNLCYNGSIGYAHKNNA